MNVEEIWCYKFMHLDLGVKGKDNQRLTSGNLAASPDMTTKQVAHWEAERKQLSSAGGEQNVFKRVEPGKQPGIPPSRSFLPEGMPRSFHDAASSSSCPPSCPHALH